jgi:hypothetical protein
MWQYGELAKKVQRQEESLSDLFASSDPMIGMPLH